MTGQTWTCPTHGTEYGDGLPKANCYTTECLDCLRAARENESEWRGEHARFRWWDRSSGIPQRYRCATVDAIVPATPSARTLRTAASQYLAKLAAHADAGRGLLLVGPPGTAKTLALCATINHACTVATGPRYASWPQVLASVKAAFNGAQDAPERHLLQALADCPLLALDEIGLRTASEYDAGALFELIDARYRETLPTLIASNVPIAQLATAIGERTSDRIRETSATITTSGDSQRGKVSCTGPDAMTAPATELITRVHTRGDWRTKESVYAEPLHGRHAL